MSNVMQLLATNNYLFAAVILVCTLLGAYLIEFITAKVLLRLASKTRTTVDDEIVGAIRRPLFLSVILIGVRVASMHLPLPSSVDSIKDPVLITLAIFIWTGGGMGIGRSVLSLMSRRVGQHKFIQPRTLPLFEITLKTILIGGAAYGLLITWHVDVTAWLASAGILGIAIGFASKDTLSNLFSGIFILADAPYKIGDFIVLSSGERGQVTDIGIRSTRILTRDDIQIIVPNAAIGGAKIVNETGGPHPKRRVRVNVGVAYGSDIDKVRALLTDIALGSEYVVPSPEPRVRFREFKEFSLHFQLLAWINEPVQRGRAVDNLNCEIYKRFAKEGINIPFPQRDIHIKEDRSFQREGDGRKKLE